MENHNIIAPALQKYYSALKSLDAFGKQGNFFDDISNLDKFFSEFRNITFVIQKAVGTETNKKIYMDLRNKWLIGDTLKWFVDSRNKITKEKPFELRKELNIDLYLPFGVCKMNDSRFVVDIESSFDDALEFIRSEFIDKLGLLEVFFTSKILFYEADEQVNLFPKIQTGITQMNEFLIEMDKHFLCECEQCCILKDQVKRLFINVQYKELSFIKDYTLELDKGVIEGEMGEMFFSMPNTEMLPLSSFRVSIDNGYFKETNGCLRKIFLSFVSMHIAIFQMQQHSIMPVFMLLYQDKTYRLLPFITTTKATVYRKVLDIIEISDFDEVNAVFYCGEYYAYDVEQLPDFHNKPYSERINSAKCEILSFTLLSKSCEANIAFNSEKIDDDEYILSEIKEIDWNESNNSELSAWLNPRL